MQSYAQYQKSRQHVASSRLANNTLHTDEQANGLSKQGKDTNSVIVVEFEESDIHNPRNWSFPRRAVTTLIVLTTGIVGGWVRHQNFNLAAM